VAVRAQGCVEIIRHSFARQIRHRPDAIERQPASFGARGHSSGLHFHCDCSAGTQMALFLRGLRYPVNRANHTAVVSSRARDRKGVKTAIRCSYTCGHHHVRYGELRIERTTEAGAHHGVGLKRLSSRVYG
jgi:hypothetical protein